MKHVVLVDHGDHYEILGDYSRSKRHSALTELQWLEEFLTHESYSKMRASHPYAIAALAPAGRGKW